MRRSSTLVIGLTVLLLAACGGGGSSSSGGGGSRENVLSDIDMRIDRLRVVQSRLGSGPTCAVTVTLRSRVAHKELLTFSLYVHAFGSDDQPLGYTLVPVGLSGTTPRTYSDWSLRRAGSPIGYLRTCAGIERVVAGTRLLEGF